MRIYCIKKKKKTQRNTHWMRALGWQECPKLRESVRRRPMVDCFCNGPSIYDHYRGDMMKTSRQVITLNMTQALIPPHPPLLFSLINKKPQACDMWGPYSLSHSDGMWFDFLCSSRECQAINPNCARLQFQLSRCWAALWITLKSGREPCVVKKLRQKDRQSAQRATVWDQRKHISFWRRDTWALEGRILWSATLTHEWNFPTESSASLFSSLSLSLLFWFHTDAFPP